MAATSEVKQIHGFTDPLTKPVMQSQNPDMFNLNLPRMFPIHRHIHIYSVARRDFNKKHVYYSGTFKGCHNGERYVKCYSVPDPPQQLAPDAERGGHRVEVEPRDEAGYRVAIDILNPNNPSTDPYWRPNALQSAVFGIGQDVDLIRFGLFPSLNDPPTEQELLKAEAVRDETYEKLVSEAFEESASNPQHFRKWLRDHPDIGTAMTATGTQADWFKATEIKMSCPNCGDSVKANIAFHKSSAGVLCIIDKKRAAEAGVTKTAV